MGGQSAALSVPNGTTSLQLGACAAGTGGSLTTQGDVLVDAHGVANLQSAGALTVQTNAGLDILSASGTKVHTPAKVEIYAGGGKGPGACGTGSPATPTDSGAPGQRGEGITDLTTGLFSLATGIQDVREANAGADTASNMLGIIAGVPAIASGSVGAMGAAGIAAGAAPTDMGTAFAAQGSKVFGYVGTALGAAKTVADGVAAVASGDVAGAIGAGVSLVGSALGVYSAEGAGGVDIEERASGKIKMVAGNAISGSAPLGISFKTATKFSVSATVQAKFETLAFSVTAGIKAGITGYGSVSLKSLAKISSDAPLFTIKAAKFEHKGAIFNVTAPTVKFRCSTATITGHGYVNKNFRVKGTAIIDKQVTMKDHIKAMKDAKIKGKQEVGGKLDVTGDLKGKAKITASGKVKGEVLESNGIKG